MEINKFIAIFIGVISLALPMSMIAQASSFGEFKFTIQFPTDQFNSYQISYLSKNGYVLKEIYSTIDMKKNTITIQGKNEYVVGVDFPLLIIEVKEVEPQFVASRTVISFHNFERYTGSASIINVNLDCSLTTVSFMDNKVSESTYSTNCCEQNFCKTTYAPALQDPEKFVMLASAAFDSKSIIDFSKHKQGESSYFLYSSLMEHNFDKMKAFTIRYGIEFRCMNANYSPTVFVQAQQHNNTIVRWLIKNHGTEWRAQLPIQVL